MGIYVLFNLDNSILQNSHDLKSIALQKTSNTYSHEESTWRKPSR